MPFLYPNKHLEREVPNQHIVHRSALEKDPQRILGIRGMTSLTLHVTALGHMIGSGMEVSVPRSAWIVRFKHALTVSGVSASTANCSVSGCFL